MSPQTKSDLRTQILQNLLERVRSDLFPSSTMLDMIESLLRDEETDRYTRLLFEKVRYDAYPSMDILRRLLAFTRD